MSDNELDNLFKEAADGFKAPKDTSAWQNMSKRLDQAGVGTSVFWNWKTVSTMAVVGITSTALVLYLSQRNTDHSTPTQIASNQQSEISKSKSDDSDIVTTQVPSATSSS